MKKLLSVLASLLLLLAANSQNGAYIEFKLSSSKGHGGSIKMNVSEFGSSSEFSMIIPQMPGGGMVMKSLMPKSNPGVIYMINDKSRSYSESNPAETGSQDTKTYTVKKLGNEKVNGYNCLHALVTEGTESHEVWNTKDMTEFSKYAEAFKSNRRMSSEKRDQALKEAGCDGFPVKTLHKGNDKEGDMTMELVKIEKKTFSKSEFEIPAGYTKSSTAGAVGGAKTQDEIMKMTPEERAKYVEEMKKQYGGGR